jgi:3-methyladenine DNA glycosylase AlkD
VNVEPLADEITDALRRAGRGSRQGHRPSAQSDFGVYVADLRRIVREYRKRLARESGEFVDQLAQALLARRVYECRQVAYELIAGHPAARDSLDVKRIEALGEGIDNWACVDGFCCTLVGQAWREGRITDKTIERWSRSPDLWWRRAAVVATVPLNVRARGGTGDPDRTLAVCGLLAGDREEMVQKAISWALRELVEWDRAGVERFLVEHAATVSARVRREVRSKLDTGSKNRPRRHTS